MAALLGKLIFISRMKEEITQSKQLLPATHIQKIISRIYQPFIIAFVKNANLYKKILEEIIQTKILNLNLHKREKCNIVERRYLNDIEINQQPKLVKSHQISSPILRSSIHPNITKKQMVEQNQSIALLQSKSDKASIKQEEFNLLKMAGDNFQNACQSELKSSLNNFNQQNEKESLLYQQASKRQQRSTGLNQTYFHTKRNQQSIRGT
ncbi:unnamed protein product [Paramecium octaurelia]|uniref:Uncharacterized protein n=1 Tax=Paramecium octaurelia TaxID=43137 RepID=A0A8S1XDK3_PAROT|nr:unnamed protein product [Paramecium octaurelia]